MCEDSKMSRTAALELFLVVMLLVLLDNILFVKEDQRIRQQETSLLGHWMRIFGLGFHLKVFADYTRKEHLAFAYCLGFWH